jgi:uncharacterized protein YbjT (DUF2867 family)
MIKPKLLIVGASGFVGEKLSERLLLKNEFEIYGISRSKRQIEVGKINWIKTDLYNSKEIENALIDIDYAIYLVHSMSPTARLDQGDFQDYEIIMADNFARAAKLSKIKQVIYLSDIQPKADLLSGHLLSRLEVEKTLTNSNVPMTILRSGMIIGQGSSSFSIFKRFVKRMKYIPLPPWSQLLTQPIDIENVLDYIEHCLANQFYFNKSFDIAGDEILSYENLIKKICEIENLKRIFFNIPKLPIFFTTKLLLPLLKSATNSVIASPDRILNISTIKKIKLNDSIKKVKTNFKSDPHAFLNSLKESNTVRSVQRIILPPNVRADIISFTYLHWLPKYFRFILKVEKDMQFLHIKLFFLKSPLLTLQHGYDKSERDRQIFYICGGLLVKKNENNGILEFREVLDGKFLIIAIHNFQPALPWWLYVPTQSTIHGMVMRSFSEWINNLNYSAKTK